MGRRWWTMVGLGLLAAGALACGGALDLSNQLQAGAACMDMKEAAGSLTGPGAARADALVAHCDQVSSEADPWSLGEVHEVFERGVADGQLTDLEADAISERLDRVPPRVSRCISVRDRGRAAVGPRLRSLAFVSPPRVDACGNLTVQVRADAGPDGGRLQIGEDPDPSQVDTCLPPGAGTYTFHFEARPNQSGVFVRSGGDGENLPDLTLEQTLEVPPLPIRLTRRGQEVTVHYDDPQDACMAGQFGLRADTATGPETIWPLEATRDVTFQAPAEVDEVRVVITNARNHDLEYHTIARDGSVTVATRTRTR